LFWQHVVTHEQEAEMEMMRHPDRRRRLPGTQQVLHQVQPIWYGGDGRPVHRLMSSISQNLMKPIRMSGLHGNRQRLMIMMQPSNRRWQMVKA